jgi:YVTN family beta-propeller protein
MKKRLMFLLLAPVLVWMPAAGQRELTIARFSAPAGERIATNDARGPVLPNGRLLTPRGRQVKIAAHPFGLALSPDGRTLVASCNGTEPFAVSILTGWQTGAPRLEQIVADRRRQQGSKLRDDEDDEFRSVFMGLAIAPDNRTLYASGGNQGGVFLFDLIERKRIATISLNDATHRNSFLGELRLTRDGRRLYVLDQANYRVVVVDTIKREIVESIPAGRAPFSIALSPDERRLYVTNVGVFRYSLVEGYDPKDPKRTGLRFPPFAYPSAEMRQGVTAEGKRVPGLGDPNHEDAASVWAYDVAPDGKLRVAAKTKTGRLIGELAGGVRVVGASSPSGVAAGRKYVFVSNANNDSVTVLDAAASRVIATIDLNILNEAMTRARRQGLRIASPQAAALARLRGQIPFGLALSRDERRLYVAEAGINAVAVVDAVKFKPLGHIPTAWFPAQLAVSDDGKQLFVANAKGFGSGPNGGPNFQAGPEGTYVGALQKGVVSLLDLPADNQLAQETAQVLANNGLLPIAEPRAAPVASVVPREFGQPSQQIQYVVFITKENRTHDQIFGDIATDSTGRALRAEPSLARYGERAGVFDRDNRIALRDVNVTPNHHQLARQFAFSDNFYLDADVSADGHRWLVGVYPNAWVETALAASYGDHRDFRPTPDSPGRLTYTGSSSALHPEDYLESGSVWEHLDRARLSFRNYGEGYELGGIEEDPDYEPTGARLPVNYPIPKALYDNTARDFPTYNMNISDQYRWRQFERDFTARFGDGRQPLPRFLNIYLPADHTAKERPEDGYPYRASFIADNDLALGRVVEFLSKRPEWKQMAIFVTEDDAQDGLDSVDAHRSLLLVISPYARRGVAVPTHTSIASIFKTIYLLLGAPPLNQYDAAAADLREAFTTTPDFTPYKCLDVDARIFDPKRVRMISRSKSGQEEMDATEGFERSHRRYAEQRRE